MSLQTLNLNLSLQINIGADGRATVAITPTDTPVELGTPATKPETVTPAKPFVQPPSSASVGRVARTQQQKDDLADTMQAIMDAPQAEPVTTEPVAPPPAKDTPPPPVVDENTPNPNDPNWVFLPGVPPFKKTLPDDFDITAWALANIENKVYNTPTAEELAKLGCSSEEYYNHPNYKMWIAPQQGEIPVPARGIDPTAEFGDHDREMTEEEKQALAEEMENPLRDAPTPRGMHIFNAMANGTFDSQRAIVLDMEYQNDMNYLPRDPQEQAELTEAQYKFVLQVREDIRAANKARESGQPLPLPPSIMEGTHLYWEVDLTRPVYRRTVTKTGVPEEVPAGMTIDQALALEIITQDHLNEFSVLNAMKKQTAYVQYFNMVKPFLQPKTDRPEVQPTQLQPAVVHTSPAVKVQQDLPRTAPEDNKVAVEAALAKMLEDDIEDAVIVQDQPVAPPPYTPPPVAPAQPAYVPPVAPAPITQPAGATPPPPPPPNGAVQTAPPVEPTMLKPITPSATQTTDAEALRVTNIQAVSQTIFGQ